MLHDYLTTSLNLLTAALFAPLVVAGIDELRQRDGNRLGAALLIAWGGWATGYAYSEAPAGDLLRGGTSAANLAWAGAAGTAMAALAAVPLLTRTRRWRGRTAAATLTLAAASAVHWLANADPVGDQFLMAATTAMHTTLTLGLIGYLRHRWRQARQPG